MYQSSSVADHIAQAREQDSGSWTLPWNSFAEFFDSRVGDSALASHPCLTYNDEDLATRREYRYAEFGAAVERMTAFLRDRAGLHRGERLATVLFNHDLTAILYFAAWRMGIAIVPINIEESTDKIRFILEDAECSALCCWHDRRDELLDLQSTLPGLRQIMIFTDTGYRVQADANPISERQPATAAAADLRPCSLDHEALIVYTSGTTGPPKGVVLTMRNLLIDADAIADWHRLGTNDRLMCVLPIHHVNGTVVTLVTPFYCKGSILLNRRFKSAGFWRTLEAEQITCVSVVPTLLEFLLDADEDVSRYRLNRFDGFICGAGPLLRETAARFEDRFHFPIRHGYGLSETTCYCCFLPNDLSVEEHRHWLRDHEFPSIGVALRHNRMAILDQEGRVLPESARGEICIRGGTVCAGYFKREDANQAAFQWGWFRSGDEGFYQRDGKGRPFFFVSGRLKELIIRGGVNISPLEIDDALKSHPLVRFAMAVPFDNRYYGEEIAAYVVPRDTVSPPTETDVLLHCRRSLPFSKCPKVVIFGTEVPYTSTGKPKRLELKGRLAPSLASYQDHQFRE